MFKVVSAISEKSFGGDGECYFLADAGGSKYPFYANLFLHSVAYNSSQTAKQYAYHLKTYLNYLEEIKMDYKSASNEVLMRFITFLGYGHQKDTLIDLTECHITRESVRYYLTVVRQFYIALRSWGIDFRIDLEKETGAKNKNSLLLGSVWDETTYKFLTDFKVGSNRERRDWIRWYNQEEIEAILSQFNTVRDAAIFSLTLEGARIDEVLSLQKEDFDPENGLFKLNRSKGRKPGEDAGALILTQRSVKLVNDYLFSERDELEDLLLDDGILICPEMFVNLKMNSATTGKPLKYKNYWKILKRAAGRAGLDPKRIRTHSGRSTRAQELFDFQSDHPGLLSDQQIQDTLRWKRSDSAFPYKNRQNFKTAQKVIEILEKEYSNGRNKEND